MPSLAVSSDVVNGKVVPKDVVSILRVINNLSVPMGNVDLKPSSICSEEGLVMIISDDRVDSTCLAV